MPGSPSATGPPPPPPAPPPPCPPRPHPPPARPARPPARRAGRRPPRRPPPPGRRGGDPPRRRRSTGPARWPTCPTSTRCASCATAGIPALLYGPPGTGKTSLVEAAFPDVITVAGDGDTTVADFTGEYTQRARRHLRVHLRAADHRDERRPGPVHRRRHPHLPGRSSRSAYPAMDGRREVTVKAHKGETITAANGFYVIGGHNPGVHGAVLTEALSSRFAVQIKVGTDYDLARSLKIDPRAITRRPQPRHPAGQRRDRLGTPAPRADRLRNASPRSSALDAAIANLAGIAPEEDRDVVADAIRRRPSAARSPPSPSAARSNPAPPARKEPPR